MPAFLTFALIAVAVIALGAAGVWAYKRRDFSSSGSEDRYTPERIIAPEQVSMLDYLHDTFPGNVVLHQVNLTDMLSVRRAADRKRAMGRLKNQQVDFVVCGEDGRPLFAFDIEQHHLSNVKAKAHQMKMKNRVLKTAGVRFLFLKNGIHRMPSPNEFRKQLDLAALPTPKLYSDSQPGNSSHQQLDSKMSDFDQLHNTTGYRESGVMGLSGLMGLGQEDADRQARQRPSTTRSRA